MRWSISPSRSGEKAIAWPISESVAIWSSVSMPVLPLFMRTLPLRECSGSARPSRLAHELRLQVHLADAIDLAGDVVAVARLLQADIAHLGAALHHRGRALDLEVLDDDHAVALSEHVAFGITDAGIVASGHSNG